MEAESPPNH